jgi:hypothetical protein
VAAGYPPLYRLQIYLMSRQLRTVRMSRCSGLSPARGSIDASNFEELSARFGCSDVQGFAHMRCAVPNFRTAVILKAGSPALRKTGTGGDPHAGPAEAPKP